jgi:Tfp pilus assembly protein PilX
MHEINLQKGMVLLYGLIFTIVLSFIVISMMNTSLLETKMAKNYQNKAQAFYNVETEIVSNEQKLLTDQKSKFVEITDSDADKLCGVTFYTIDIKKTVDTAVSEVVSSFAKFGDFSKCESMPKFKEGRQSFKIIM